jgi:hypothetical protein
MLYSALSYLELQFKKNYYYIFKLITLLYYIFQLSYINVLLNYFNYEKNKTNTVSIVKFNDKIQILNIHNDIINNDIIDDDIIDNDIIDDDDIIDDEIKNFIEDVFKRPIVNYKNESLNETEEKVNIDNIIDKMLDYISV